MGEDKYEKNSIILVLLPSKLLIKRPNLPNTLNFEQFVRELEVPNAFVQSPIGQVHRIYLNKVQQYSIGTVHNLDLFFGRYMA